MTAFQGLLLMPSGDGCDWVPGRFDVVDGRIARLERVGVVGAAKRVFAPGLIDMHVHGFGGWGPTAPIDEWRASADSTAPLAHMAQALARAGTTAFLPTLFPAEPTALNRTARTVWETALATNATTSAHVLGLHLEGPFVNPLAAGALPLDDLAEPSPAALRSLLAGMPHGAIRTLTLAPELAGAHELVRELEALGIRASFGHSRAKAADTRALMRDFPSTPFGITHLFNAMSGVDHRDPGLAHLALCDASLFAELIGDLVHVGREGIELALAARGPGHLCLISDALAGAGTGCDVFHSHGRSHVIKEGAAYYPEADQLAGSATGQWEAIQRLVAAGVLAPSDALTMATLAPARALGVETERGVIANGAAADLLELDLSGAVPELVEVWVAGRRVGLAD